MALKDGDVIAFDYELWVEGQPKLHDTTLREAAERDGVLDENAWYGPVHYVIGSGRVIPGLEKALRDARLGETREVDVAAAEGYGERDPKLVETVPISEFRKNDVEPQQGLVVNYKNRRGAVVTVGGGRVRVDFNPPLAGKRLKYRYTLRSVAKNDEERLLGLLRMHVPGPLEWKTKAGKSEGKNTATVDVPGPAVVSREWLLAKFRVLTDARRFTDLDEVRFVEAYPLPKEGGVAARAQTQVSTAGV